MFAFFLFEFFFYYSFLKVYTVDGHLHFQYYCNSVFYSKTFCLHFLFKYILCDADVYLLIFAFIMLHFVFVFLFYYYTGILIEKT